MPKNKDGFFNRIIEMYRKNNLKFRSWYFIGPILTFAAVSNAAIFSIEGGGGINPTEYPLNPSSQVFRTKEFTNSIMEGVGQPGTIKHNVNLVDGQPSYQVPIGTLNANGQIAFPIALTYGGSVRGLYDSDVERGPTSWIGYGWNLSLPFVAVNNNGTVSTTDDAIFCNLGPFGGGQLMQKAGKYFLASDPTIFIQYATDVDGGIINWTFTTTTGIKIIFGGNSATHPNCRYIQKVGTTYSGGPYNLALSKPVVYRWDVATVSDYNAKNTIHFTFKPSERDISTSSAPGKKYIHESYPYEISWKDGHGNQIEKYLFWTFSKNTQEYFESFFGSMNSGANQQLYETKFLDKITHVVDGRRDREWVLESTPNMGASSPRTYPYMKRFLNAVQIYSFRNNQAQINDPNSRWGFEYDVNHYCALKKITRPYGGIDEFQFGRLDYSGQDPIDKTGLAQDNISKNIIDPNFNAVDISNISQNELKDKWENESFCTEKYCIVAAINRNVPKYTPNPNTAFHDRLFLNIYKNNGNRFTNNTLATESLWGREINSNDPYSLKIIPWGDKFLVLDSKAKHLFCYLWDGTQFRQEQIRIFRKSSTGVRGEIKTYGYTNNSAAFWDVSIVGENIVIKDYIYKNQCNEGELIIGTKLWIIKRVGENWIEVNEDTECQTSPSCVLNNGTTPNAYGEDIKTSSMSCLEFNSNILMSAGNNLINFVHTEKDIIVSYALDKNGNLVNVSNKYLSFNIGTQRGSYYNNWDDYQINYPTQFGPDYFVIESTKKTIILQATTELHRLDIIFWDGENFRLIGSKTANNTAHYSLLDKKVLYFYPHKDYALIVNKITQAGEFWIRKVTPDEKIQFSFVSNFKTGIVSSDNSRYQIKTYPNMFTFEQYGSSLAVNPLTVNGNYRTDLFQINKNSLDLNWSILPMPSNFLDTKGRNLFNIQLMPQRNILVGMACVTQAGGVCTDENALGVVCPDQVGPCPGATNISLFSVKMSTGLTGNIQFSNRQIVPMPVGSFHRIHGIFSGSNDIAVASTINLTTKKIDMNLLHINGNGFQDLPHVGTFDGKLSSDYSIVRTFTSRNNINNSQANDYKSTAKFLFQEDATDIIKPEFNFYSQGFLFSNNKVLVSKSGPRNSGSDLAEFIEEDIHLVENINLFSSEFDFGRHGFPVETKTNVAYNDQGGIKKGRTIANKKNALWPRYTDFAWPDKLYTHRLQEIISESYSDNGSFLKSKVQYLGYNYYNNKPLFTRKRVGEWDLITQNLYYVGPVVNKGIPFQTINFRIPIRDLYIGDDQLNNWAPADKILDINGAKNYIIGSSKVRFDDVFIFKPSETWAWQDADYTRNDQEIASGVEPIRDINANWRKTSTISYQSQLGTPKEILRYPCGSACPPDYSSMYYEGRRGDLIASVGGSSWRNSSVVNAENGSVSQLTASFDLDGRWPKTSTSVYASNQYHTGRYSIKVNSEVGLKGRILMDQTQSGGFDYIVSAWIYSETTNPLLKVTSSPGGVSLLTQVPVNKEPFSKNKWQRYEIRIKKSDLIGSGGRFTLPDRGDYLSVEVGSGDATVGSTKVVYVDDIVCRPANSTLSMQSYSDDGLVISKMNQTQIPTFIEYDGLGKPSAIRDASFRSFNASSSHMPGDND